MSVYNLSENTSVTTPRMPFMEEPESYIDPGVEIRDYLEKNPIVKAFINNTKDPIVKAFINSADDFSDEVVPVNRAQTLQEFPVVVCSQCEW